MVGKGTIYNALARFAFLISGYVIQFSMAYLVSPREYGTLGVVLSLVTLARTFLSTGLPQSAARYIAADEARSYTVWRAAAKLQLGLGLALTFLYLGGTSLWGTVLDDRSLLGYMALSAPMILFMAWFQINLAYFNGRLWFGKQAALLLLYSVLRGTIALVFVLIGWAVFGAVLGLVLAIGIAAVASHVAIPRGEIVGTQDWRELVSFSVPIVLAAIGVSVILNLDILILKSFFPESDCIGFYNGAMNLGKAPYFVFYAFAATLLPAVSRAFSEKGREEACRIARRSVSFLLMASIPVAVIVATTADKLMDFVYRESYVAGAGALQILIVSMCLLSLLGALTATVTGAGRPGLVTIVVVGGIPLQAGLGWWLVPRYEMLGTALANLVTVTAAVVAVSGLVFKYIGSVYDLVRVGKMLLAVVPVGVGLILFDGYPVMAVPGVYLLGLVVYGGLLLVLRGVSVQEIKKMVPGRARRASA